MVGQLFHLAAHVSNFIQIVALFYIPIPNSLNHLRALSSYLQAGRIIRSLIRFHFFWISVVNSELLALFLILKLIQIFLINKYLEYYKDYLNVVIIIDIFLELLDQYVQKMVYGIIIHQLKLNSHFLN